MAEHQPTRVEELVDNLFGFWRSGALRACMDLHLIDHITSGRTTGAEIAAAEGLEPRVAEVLLGALCALRLATRTGDQYHVRRETAELLTEGGPLRPYISFFGRGSWDAWGQLADLVRAPQRPSGPRPEFWPAHARATFGMALIRGAAAARLLDVAHTPNLRILDAPCGSAGLGLALLQAEPTATVVGIDSEDVLAVAAEHADSLGLRHRLELHARDLLAEGDLALGTFDVAVLSGFLNALAAVSRARLLRKAFDSLVPGGRLLVADPMAGVDADHFTPFYSVMITLTGSEGLPYTVPELTELLTDTGFESVTQEHLDGYWACVTARRPS